MADSNTDQKSTREAEREVEAARANLAGSIDSLEARLSPDALVERGIAYFQGDGRRHLDTLVRNAQANPIPLVLIGIGVAWLAMGSGRNPRPGSTDRRVSENRLYGRDDDTPASNVNPSSSGLGASATDASTLADQPRTTGLSTDTRGPLPDEPRDPPRSSGLATGAGPAVSNDPVRMNAASGKPAVASKPATKAGTDDDKDAASFRDPITTAHSTRDEDKKT
ncbi:DUF3618 domain-containing protein [uncultured Jannaschia sp.]|uniref:DUF3618 domain-containing protein n=1 Tax=uncultured Jannaschia sp. TaxID=293347 RepID=UPI002610565B|nr:DUF3618 domain-containing protein [uncultured Jannaschia sp.]